MKEHGDRDLNMFKKLRDLRCTVNMKFHLLNAKAPAEIYCAKTAEGTLALHNSPSERRANS
jgi:hypothetical protein